MLRCELICHLDHRELTKLLSISKEFRDYLLVVDQNAQLTHFEDMFEERRYNPALYLNQPKYTV